MASIRERTFADPLTHVERGALRHQNDPEEPRKIATPSILLAAPEARPSTSTNDFELAPVVSASLGRACLQYCLLLIALPLLAIPACIAFGTSNFFLHHGASVWVRANDAVFDMHDRDCYVLIFGDSTAMTGIDPDLLAARTGFRTCNIAVTNAVLAVTGNLTLDHFLASNPRPHILLIQLSPDSFEPRREIWHQTIYAEGLLELLRRGDPAQIHRVLLSHPQESIAFAGYAAGYGAWYVLRDIWSHLTHRRPEEDTLRVRNGFFTPPAPALTSCAPLSSLPSPAQSSQPRFSRDLVAGFQHQYAGQATVVLVNVAPIPACDGNLAAYQAELHGLTSNSLQPLPVTLFNDDRHYTASGSKVVSSAIVQELQTVASQPVSDADRLPPSGTIALLHRFRLHPPYRHLNAKP